MNKWQRTRYLIDAKKCIDSLLYIDDNIEKLKNLDLYKIIEGELRLFYINLCVVLDNSIEKQELKDLKTNDKIIKKIYYERDKNYAHKDENYDKEVFNKIKQLIQKLEMQLEHCYIISKSKLPENITIDYVSHDKNLFRFVNMISSNLEEKIKSILYENWNKNISQGKEEYPVFNDTEEIKRIKNRDDYAVIMENGLTLKESLQNYQDTCIRINVLHNLNIWCSINGNVLELLSKDEGAFISFLSQMR